MEEIELDSLDSGTLRWEEAHYFYDQFVMNSGPHDSHFLMICYLDAFLYTLISIEEVVSKSTSDAIRKNDSFLFLKALRNTNAHHIVLGIGLKDSKFPHPITHKEIRDESPYTFTELRLQFDKLRQVFTTIEKERKSEKKTLDGAERFMEYIESQKREGELIEEFMNEGLRDVEIILGQSSI